MLQFSKLFVRDVVAKSFDHVADDVPDLLIPVPSPCAHVSGSPGDGDGAAMPGACHFGVGLRQVVVLEMSVRSLCFGGTLYFYDALFLDAFLVEDGVGSIGRSTQVWNGMWVEGGFGDVDVHVCFL